jgi:hypothetical protein
MLKAFSFLKYDLSVITWLHLVPLNVQPVTTACHSAEAASELYQEMILSHNAEHNCRMIVGGFQVPWDILYIFLCEMNCNFSVLTWLVINLKRH